MVSDANASLVKEKIYIQTNVWPMCVCACECVPNTHYDYVHTYVFADICLQIHTNTHTLTLRRVHAVKLKQMFVTLLKLGE